MSTVVPRSRRFRGVVEVAVCALLVAGVSVFALWRMGFLADTVTYHTDQSRTAYVAKNLVEGRGYTTNDMPAYLVDFYDDRGKLDKPQWVNADRFPFVAYAIALLYTVTGSHTDVMGVLVYNTLWFVAFLTLLFWLTRRIWGNRYAAAAAVVIALLHPYTYFYLYLKDADMLFLTTACLGCLHRYFQRPERTMSLRMAVVLGTLFGWLFLCRPNLAAAYLLFFGLLVLHGVVVARRRVGWWRALRSAALGEGVAVLVFALWCLPFAIHSQAEWGSLFFSANGVYQLPLGTRYAMGTDTWWKYTDPATTVTLQTLIEHAPDQLVGKFTSSWVMTFKRMISTYAIELFLACGLVAWLSTRAEAEARAATADEVDVATAEARRPVLMLAALTGFALVTNLALLPLFGAQSYGYHREYLGFMMPLVWLAAGQGVYLLAHTARPHVDVVMERVKANRGILIAVVVAVIAIWNLGTKSDEANALFAATSKLVGRHWMVSAILLVALLARKYVRRRPGAVGLVLASALVIVQLQPSEDLKRTTLFFFPAEKVVGETLRQRTGIVSSFATSQGVVTWMSGRRHVPAPELVMHLYSFLFDHGLEIEDVYLESAQGLISAWPFALSAPGFEGYVRLQRYQGPLPGYRLILHEETVKGFPALKIRPTAKASTIYRLVDREAVQRLGKSPDRLELGDIANIVHTAHGFEGYYMIDGKPVVAATDITTKRYPPGVAKPWESTAITFFIEDGRRPSSVELEVYSVHATTLELYWNLDLYDYNRRDERKGHLLGTFAIPGPGWHRIRLDVPAHLVRAGLNKLGFRSMAASADLSGQAQVAPDNSSPFQAVVACPQAFTEEACLRLKGDDDDADAQAPTLVLRQPPTAEPAFMRVSVFVGALQFGYGAGQSDGPTALPGSAAGAPPSGSLPATPPSVGAAAPGAAGAPAPAP